MAEMVIDASALVDLLLGNDLGRAVRSRIAGQALHGPAHLDAEVLSAVVRLYRAGTIDAHSVDTMLDRLLQAPIQRHELPPLLRGAWERRHQLRLADALYVQLAVALGVQLVTTDARLHPVAIADVILA